MGLHVGFLSFLYSLIRQFIGITCIHCVPTEVRPKFTSSADTVVQLIVIQPFIHIGFNLMRRRIYTNVYAKIISVINIPDNFEKITLPP